MGGSFLKRSHVHLIVVLNYADDSHICTAAMKLKMVELARAENLLFQDSTESWNNKPADTETLDRRSSTGRGRLQIPFPTFMTYDRFRKLPPMSWDRPPLYPTSAHVMGSTSALATSALVSNLLGNFRPWVHRPRVFRPRDLRPRVFRPLDRFPFYYIEFNKSAPDTIIYNLL